MSLQLLSWVVDTCLMRRLISLFLHDLNFSRIKSYYFFQQNGYKFSIVFFYENVICGGGLPCHSLVACSISYVLLCAKPSPEQQ